MELGRLYLLLGNGEIWIFDTENNPTTIVDIWKNAENSTFSELI
jgi:hypothetical protein